MMDVLDRDKLLLALKGQYKSESEKPVFVQELQQDIADQLSSLSVQGFKSLTIPIPKQVSIQVIYNLYIQCRMLHLFLSCIDVLNDLFYINVLGTWKVKGKG